MQTKIFLFLLIFFISCNTFSQNLDKNSQIKYLQKTLQLTNEELSILINSEEQLVNKIYTCIKVESNQSDLEKKLIKEIINHIEVQREELKKYTKDNYPGKDDGYPFEWWKDEKWIKENLKL